MSIRLPSNPALLAELTLLIAAHHPLWAIESVEEDRVEALLWDLAERAGLPFFSWSPVTGLVRQGPDGGRPLDTQSIVRCLAFIEQANTEAIFHLRGMTRGLDDLEATARVKEIYRRYFQHRGTVVISGAEIELSKDLEPLFDHLELPPPDPRRSTNS